MAYCIPIKKTEYNKERDVTTFYTFSGAQYEMKGNHCVEESKLKIVYESTPIDKEVFSFNELKYVKNKPTSNLL